MTEVYAFATEQQRDEVDEMVRWWRLRRSVEDSIALQPERLDRREFEIVALLDDLESGGSVPARVLAPVASDRVVQCITALGSPGGGYFRLGFAPSSTAETEWTEIIYPMLDDAATITRYLGKLPSLGIGTARVGLGLITIASGANAGQYNAWRWLIEFGGRYAGQTVPTLEVDGHLTDSYLIVQSEIQWTDTGETIDVYAPLPVPTPTPLRRGAIAAAFPRRRFGHVVIACEPRDFGDYGLF